MSRLTEPSTTAYADWGFFHSAIAEANGSAALKKPEPPHIHTEAEPR